MPDNLLAQAIADAKTVREMAYAEAKNKLEAAFQPHLENMLSSRLLSEAKGLTEDNDGTSGIGGTAVTVDNPGPKEPSTQSSSSSHIENPGQELDTFGDGSAEKKPLKEDAGIEDLDTPGSAPAQVAPTTPQGVPSPAIDMSATPGPQGMDGVADTPDELDLEAIIRQLELDSQSLGSVPEPQLSQGFGQPQAPQTPQQPPQVEAFSDPMAGAKVNGTMDGALKETLAGKSGDGTFHDGKSPKAVDGVNGGKKVTPGQEVTAPKSEKMMESEHINLEEILRELSENDDDAMSEVEQLKVENTQLKSSIQEHRQVVTFLRDKLQEVNVLNAKLLFTNRLFKNFDLKVEQKENVVKTFDRAASVREVQLVYTTLAESLSGKLNTAARKKTVSAITEGLSSKTIGSTVPKSPEATKPANILTEGDTQVARLQKLAGIIKK